MLDPLFIVSDSVMNSFKYIIAYIPTSEKRFIEKKTVNQKFLEFLTSTKKDNKYKPDIAAEKFITWLNGELPNKGSYLIVKDLENFVQVNLVCGEFEKDWDLKLEVLYSIANW